MNSKIIFTVTTDLIYDQRMERICTVLAQEGYNVCIIGREKPDSAGMKNRPYRQVRFSCFFNKGKLFYIEFNIRLFFYLLFSSADIICSVDLDTALPGFVIARLRGKKFVYDAHEYFTEVIEVVRRPLIRKMWSMVEQFILTRTQYAYTVSENLKNLYEKKYPVSFEVIRNVPVLENYEEPVKEDKHLVYIGAVNEGRGLEEMIEVMPLVNSKLYVYGQGDLYSDLIKEVNEKGLQDKIKFFGYVEPVDLKELTRKAYIGVLLLRDDSASYYYSLANKFFDYIHAGIPQVTIDFPEYRAINDQVEVAVLTSLQISSIAGAINRLLNDDVYYQQLKENCFKARETFNWQNESKKLLTFYRSVNGH